MRNRTRRDLTDTLVAAGLFCAAVAAGAAIRPRLPAWYRDSMITALHMPSGDSYLANSRGGIDFYELYFDLDDSIAPVSRADVLFLGNSRAMYGFRGNGLRSFFQKEGLRFYNLAFGYNEGSVFSQALIEKYDLHPRWVVINADPFFQHEASKFGSKVVAESRFDAFKFRLETYLSFVIGRRLHRIVPYLSPLQVPQEGIWYRSLTDGTVTLSGYRDQTPQDTPEAGEFNAFTLPVAKRFKEEMDRRGIRIVLTCVPPVSSDSARRLGRELQVPVLLPEVPGLKTFDGSHLYLESAERFSTAFLKQFQPLLEGGGREK